MLSDKEEQHQEAEGSVNPARRKLLSLAVWTLPTMVSVVAVKSYGAQASVPDDSTPCDPDHPNWPAC